MTMFQAPCELQLIAIPTGTITELMRREVRFINIHPFAEFLIFLHGYGGNVHDREEVNSQSGDFR